MEQKVDRLGSLLKTLAVGGGTALGTYLGNPAAGQLAGQGISSLIGKLRGSGDYEVNSLIKPGSERAVGASPPTILTSGSCLRVQKREFVGFVYTSATATIYANQTYRVNPGNPILFPYLSSTLALGFKKWRPLGMVMELVSEATEYSTTQPLGTMGIAVDYQSYDQPFSTLTSALQADGAMSVKVSSNLTSGLECAVGQRADDWLLIRNGPPPGGDLNKYDLAYASVWTQGSSAVSAPVAQLWVSYDIELCDPILNGGLNGAGCYGAMFSNTNCTTIAPFGTTGGTPLLSGDYDIGTNLINSNYLVFPSYFKGTYLVTIFWSGVASGGVTAPTFVVAGNLIKLGNVWQVGALPGTGDVTLSSANVLGGNFGAGICAVVVVPDSVNVVTAGGLVFTGASWAGNAAVRVVISQLPFQPTVSGAQLPTIPLSTSGTSGTWS
jgi:hypothetical protein